MKTNNLRRLFHESDGKGLIGCVFSIALLLAAVFIGITLGPIYYSNYTFESEVKTEVSRAGARIVDNETIIRNITELAKRNEIRIQRKDIRVDRYAGQVHVDLQYSVPVDLFFMQRDWTFRISVSSFVGSL